MKGLRWSSRGKKTSNEGKSTSNVRKTPISSINSNHTTHPNQSQNSSKHNTSLSLNNPISSSTSVSTSSPSVENNSLYLSELNTRSVKSFSSSLKEDNSSETGSVKNDQSTTSSEVTDVKPARANSINTISTSGTFSTNNTTSTSLNSTVINVDNYDSKTFKLGWVNKCHGQLNYSTNKDSKVYHSGGSLGDAFQSNESSQHSQYQGNFANSTTSSSTPDYRLYRAELKGCILSLFKSGIGNVKCFDPLMEPPSDFIESHRHSLQSPQPQRPHQHSHQLISRPDSRSSFEATGCDYEDSLQYLSPQYPHPNLKLDKDDKIVSGSIESLCHAVLFMPNDDVKKVLDIILLLPLINDFEKFLQCFNLFGITFTKHKARLIHSSKQYLQISPSCDDMLTRRLALVVKTILDVFPGLLLDDKLFQYIITLIDMISLHNDEISNNLKTTAMETQFALTKLVKFTKDPQTVDRKVINKLMSIDSLMELDLDVVADQIHQINLKFYSVWNPQSDYSLLYHSKFNKKHTVLNPFIFANDENVHYLGRLLVSHLFSNDKNIDNKKRASVLKRWVELGCKFEKLGDMVSWLSVATIICSIPVLRLSKVWQYISDSTLKIIFKDWVPTIVQLDRRQTSSKSTNSVFILAPPNLNDPFVRKNVIPYFGDLVIYVDDLPAETKFKHLEKKIHRTKNAFYKWQQRLQQALSEDEGGTEEMPCITGKDDSYSYDFYQFWKYHINQPNLNIDKIMDFSLQLEPPSVDQKLYSNFTSKRNQLSTGGYLPVLFTELFSNCSLFPKDSLLSVAGFSHDGEKISALPSPQPNKSLSISGPIHLNETFNEDYKKKITGTDDIDEAILKELSTKQFTNQRILNTVKDIFNVDMDFFHISDDIIFKSGHRTENTASRPSKRFSIQSSSKDSVAEINGLSTNLENMDFFSIDQLNHSIIKVVLKCASLDKIFDILVLTTSIFSKLVDNTDLENYFQHEREREKLSETHSVSSSTKTDAIGLLDFAFIKMVMDSDLFTETFFNNYKSFTTTTTVLEYLAKRFIGAKSCAVSINRIMKIKPNENQQSNRFSGLFDMASNNTRFPSWDLKMTENDDLSFVHVSKVQIGCMEALLHLVKEHYSDFTDDLINKRTFLDILKIMDQEINDEWVKRLDQFENVDEPSMREQQEYFCELTNSHSILKDLFDKIKSSFQRQLYRPLNINRSHRKTLEYFDSFVPISMGDYNLLMMTDIFEDDEMVTKFFSLTGVDHLGIVEWVNTLDTFIWDKLKLVSTQEWVEVSQILELFSSDSLTSFFQYPLHALSSNLIVTGTFQLDDLKISNIFDWISSVSYENGDLLISKFPISVQLIIKLHTSLTRFFTVQISHLNKTCESRLDTCMVILEILCFSRWKNSRVNLFFNAENDKNDPAISSHIPSFIESSIINSIISPESRHFEMSWKHAYQKLVGVDSVQLKSIEQILVGLDDKIRLLSECDTSQSENPKVLCLCPGWLISRLLEISQFMPNMSLENSKLINFDKRRFVNNIVNDYIGILSDRYCTYGNDDSKSDDVGVVSSTDHTSKPLNESFGSVLLYDVTDIKKQFMKRSKEISAEEAKQMKFQVSGLFNELLVVEVSKIQRDQKKKEQLILQERDYKRTVVLQQTMKQKSKSGVSTLLSSPQPHPQVGVSSSPVSPSSATTYHRSKRSSISSSRNSIISNNHNHNGVSKKLGGFFKRPFSISGFTNSQSTQQQQPIILNDVSSNGFVSPYALPHFTSTDLQDSKPIFIIKTFEIKSCIQFNSYRQDASYMHCFKIILDNGIEHIIQTYDSRDMNDWMKSITLSKRYSFHSKKFKGQTSNKIFGVPIENVCEREGSVIPNIVVKLLDEIELRGLDEVGLYRIPGSIGSINALKNAFNEEGAVNNTFTLDDGCWFEINTIAGCFKLYLRELPESLFTNDKLLDFVETVNKFKTGDILNEVFNEEIKELLKSLPVYNYQMMKRIFNHLNKVHLHVENNRMDATNLAIVFSMSFIDQDDLAGSMGPTLGSIQTLLQYFIRSPETYFS